MEKLAFELAQAVMNAMPPKVVTVNWNGREAELFYEEEDMFGNIVAVPVIAN